MKGSVIYRKDFIDYGKIHEFNTGQLLKKTLYTLIFSVEPLP